MARSRRIQIYLLSVTLALVALAGVLYTTAVASSPPPPDPAAPPESSPPPPVYPLAPERPPMTLEEEQRAREKAAKEAKGHTIIVSGPETAGRLIQVAGREVQLPSDAFVNRYVVDVFCVAGLPCPEVPIYELVRGDSTIAVSAPSGTVVEEDIADGEEGAFDFLKGVLP